jgi:hypothetical protein
MDFFFFLLLAVIIVCSHDVRKEIHPWHVLVHHSFDCVRVNLKFFSTSIEREWEKKSDNGHAQPEKNEETDPTMKTMLTRLILKIYVPTSIFILKQQGIVCVECGVRLSASTYSS